MDASSANTIFAGYTTDLGDVLADNLPLVVAILAGLIGLGIVVRYARRWIGRK